MGAISATSQVAHLISTSPGVYAVLLGSGVSRGSGIPTGWDITLDLVSKLARLRDEEPLPTPEEWYRKTFDSEPAYSDIVEMLAPKGDERRALLNQYFEPTPDEREQGLKQPSAAHRSIARLVAGGFVKVILTTNFDRLMERALEEVGVSPIVVKSIDDLRGAVPLVHARCVVVKLHGDYLDVRFRNTTSELENYDPELNAYISRIFDEFGLVISGWSSDWDSALRKLVCEGAGRRYGAFWCARGSPSATAKVAIARCAANVVEIESADAFFQDLADRVDALAEFGSRETMSVDQTVALVKLYSSESKYRTRLNDLFASEVDLAAAAIKSADIESVSIPEEFRRAVGDLDASSSTLRAALTVGVATDVEENSAPYVRPILLLHDRLKRVAGGTRQPLRPLEWLPLAELFYAIGTIALWRGSFGTIRQLFDLQFPGEYADRSTALDLLPATLVGGWEKRHWQRLEGRERQHLPLNEHLAQLLEPDGLRAGLTSEEWKASFNRFEILITLAYSYRNTGSGRFWGPPGRYAYGLRFGRDHDSLAWLESDSGNGPSSAMTTAGLFAGKPEDLTTTMNQFKEWLPELARAFW